MSKEYDVYRDSWWRYLGYANEVGEACRPLVPGRLVTLSYAVATSYVLADVADKAWKSWSQTKSSSRTCLIAGDVFIWQMLASVVVPGFTINRITSLTAYLLKAQTKQGLVRLAPTLVGLCSIPFIVEPIDHMTDKLMDNTYRKLV